MESVVDRCRKADAKKNARQVAERVASTLGTTTPEGAYCKCKKATAAIVERLPGAWGVEVKILPDWDRVASGEAPFAGTPWEPSQARREAVGPAFGHVWHWVACLPGVGLIDATALQLASSEEEFEAIIKGVRIYERPAKEEQWSKVRAGLDRKALGEIAEMKERVAASSYAAERTVSYRSALGRIAAAAQGKSYESPWEATHALPWQPPESGGMCQVIPAGRFWAILSASKEYGGWARASKEREGVC